MVGLFISTSLSTSNITAPAVDPDKAIRVARFFSYPKQVLYLTASFIALVSLCHFISLLYRYTTRNRVFSSTTHRTTPSLQRLPIAVIDSLRALAFRWTISVGSSYTLNLAELGMTLGYTGALLSWTFVNTTSTLGVKVEPHYYANRAGTIAASQLPIMTALGMRNNIISSLTGISFEKLNYLHRISARVICILIWIHAGGRVTVGLLGDETLAHRWVQCGVLAGTTLTLLCLLTLRPIRKRYYEMFLVVHFVFVFMFLLAIYFHLTGRNLTFYGAWPSMILWGVDRLLRLLNLWISNFDYLNPWSKASKKLDATIQILSPRFLKVTVLRPKHFQWRAGQSAYLTFPSLSSSMFPFESHPFTISTIDDDPTAVQKKLTFFVRVRNGFTKRLMQKASMDQTYKVFVNGPYSSPPVLVGHQTILLIAGGSGVAFTLPLFLDLIRAKRNPHVSRRIVFIWAVRDADQIKWIEGSLLSVLKSLPKSLVISVEFYVTNAFDQGLKGDWDDGSNSHSMENVVEDAEKTNSASSFESGPRLLKLPFVKLEQGQRPDLASLIKEEIENGMGSLSINVCGTDAISETVRRAVRAPRPMDILRGGPTVSLHVEAFGGSVSFPNLTLRIGFLNSAAETSE